MANSSLYPDSVQAGLPVELDKPLEWTRVKFGDVLHPVERPVKLTSDELYQLVTVKRSRGGVVKRQVSFGKDVKTPSQFYVHADDFLISRRQIVHGACAIVPLELNDSIVSNEYAILRPESNLYLKFFEYFSHTLYFQQTCFHSSIGVHVEKMVFRLENWLEWHFNLPPLSEQIQIATILSTWDDSLSTLARLIDTKRQQKRALAEQLLTGKRSLEGFEEEWQAKTLGQVAEFSYGKSQNGISVVDGKWPIYGTAGIVGRTDSVLFSNESIIIGRKGTVDRPVYVNIPFWAIDTTFYVSRIKDVTVKYLFYFLEKFDFKSINESSGVPSISRDNLRNVNISFPSMRQQKAIISVLSTLDTEIDLLTRQQAKVQEQKRGLMDLLLTGKVRVKAPEEVPA